MSLYNKIIFILSLIIVIANTSLACDGCSVYEYNPVQTKSYIGLFYRYSFFNGYSESQEENRFTLNPNNLQGSRIEHFELNDGNATHIPHKNDYEIFETYDLRANYNYEDILNLNINIPYRVNTGYNQLLLPSIGASFDTILHTKGMGDISIGALGVKKIESDNFTQKTQIGLYLTIPTGKFNLVNANRTLNDPHHQAGQGAWMITPRIFYTLLFKSKLGFSMFANLSFNSKKEVDNSPIGSYKPGNSMNFQGRIFYLYKRNDWVLIPSIGVYHERMKADLLGDNEWKDTGGNSTFFLSQIEIRFKNISLQGNYYIPIQQNWNGNQLQNTGRIQLGLLYFFNKDKNACEANI